MSTVRHAVGASMIGTVLAYPFVVTVSVVFAATGYELPFGGQTAELGVALLVGIILASAFRDARLFNLEPINGSISVLVAAFVVGMAALFLANRLAG